jgi:hypothetical protein
MNNLQIGNKIYSAIQFNGGWIWGYINESCKMGQIGLTQIDGILEGSWFIVVAQTPEVRIEGVPIVEVEDIYDKLADDWLMRNYPNQSVRGEKFTAFIAGYKASQSKSCYTEEQMYVALTSYRIALYKSLYKGEFGVGNDTWIKEYLKSIQPTIVVEMVDMNDYDDDKIATTYIKDGQTYFKLKSV